MDHASSSSQCSQRLSPTPSPSPSPSPSSTGKSDVWKFYEKIVDSNKVKCLLCSKQLSYRGGTSNLRDHLVSQHPLNYKPKGTKKQVTLDSFSKSRHCPEARAKEITDRIINMLAVDLRPAYMVECEGF